MYRRTLILLAALFCAPAHADESDPYVSLTEYTLAGKAVRIYYDKLTEQVCTLVTPIMGSQPALSCIPLQNLRDPARRNIIDRLAKEGL